MPAPAPKKKSLKPVKKVQANVAGNAGGAALVVIAKAVGVDLSEELAAAVIVVAGFIAAYFKKA